MENWIRQTVIAGLFLSTIAAHHVAADVIAAGRKDGPYYAVAEAITPLLQKGGYSFHVKPTAGSIENIQLLFKASDNHPRALLAIVQSDVLYRTQLRPDVSLPKRLEPFRHRLKDVKTLLALFPEYVQILVNDDSDLRTIFQLRGQALFIGKKSSGTRLIAYDILEFAGALDDDNSDDFRSIDSLQDVVDHARLSLQELNDLLARPEPLTAEDNLTEKELGFDDAKKLVLANKIDAAFIVQGTIVREDGLRHLSIRKERIEKFRHRHNYYGVKERVLDGGATHSMLFTRANLVALGDQANLGFRSEDAEKITELLFDNSFRLEAKASEALNSHLPFFVDEGMVRCVTDNLHSGAEDYFKRKKIIPSMMLYEWVFLVALLLIVLTLLVNALRNLPMVRAILQSSKIARFHYPGSPFEKVWRKYYKWTCGSGLTMLVWIFVIIFVGVVYMILRIEQQHSIAYDVENPFAGISFLDGARWMLTFATTGFHQGIYPNTTGARILAVVVPVFGVLLTVWFLLSRTFKSDRETEKRAKGKIPPPRLKKHILVCGWNDRVPQLLRDLTSRSSPLPAGGSVLVIAETPEEKPLENLDLDLRRVGFLRGRSSDYERLRQAKLQDTIGAIVVAGNMKIANNNHRSILTCTAISKKLTDRQRNGDFNLVAELFYKQNRDHFCESGVDKLACLTTISTRMITHAALNPGISGLLVSLMRFATAMSVRVLSPGDIHGVDLVGKPFWNAFLEIRKSNLLLLSVYRPPADKKRDVLEIEFREDSPYFFRPTGDDENYLISEHDKLIVIKNNPKSRQEDVRFLREGSTFCFKHGKEGVLIIGNGWFGDEVVGVLSSRARKVVRLIRDSDLPEKELAESVENNTTTIRTSRQFDENFFREHADRFSDLTRAVILGPDRLGHDGDSEIYQDDATVLYAMVLREVSRQVFLTTKSFHILAEMRCIENLDLFHDAGIDQPVPTTMMVEQCLVQMVFHKGLVAELFLKAMSYSPKNKKGRLKRMAVTTLSTRLQENIAGWTFDQLLRKCAEKKMQLLAIQKVSTARTSEYPLEVNPPCGEKDPYKIQTRDYVFLLASPDDDDGSEVKATLEADDSKVQAYRKSRDDLKAKIKDLFKDCNAKCVEAGGAHVFVVDSEHFDFIEDIGSDVQDEATLRNVCSEIGCVFEESQNPAIRSLIQKVNAEVCSGNTAEVQAAFDAQKDDPESNKALVKAARALRCGSLQDIIRLRDFLSHKKECESDRDKVHKLCRKWTGKTWPGANVPIEWAGLHLGVLQRLKGMLRDMHTELGNLPSIIIIEQSEEEADEE